MLLAWPPPVGVAPIVHTAPLAAKAPFVVLPPLAADSPPGDNQQVGVTAPRVPTTSFYVALIILSTALVAAPLDALSSFSGLGHNP